MCCRKPLHLQQARSGLTLTAYRRSDEKQLGRLAHVTSLVVAAGSAPNQKASSLHGACGGGVGGGERGGGGGGGGDDGGGSGGIGLVGGGDGRGGRVGCKRNGVAVPRLSTAPVESAP